MNLIFLPFAVARFCESKASNESFQFNTKWMCNYWVILVFKKMVDVYMITWVGLKKGHKSEILQYLVLVL